MKKTSKQVKDWMQSQDWWESFVKEFIEQGASKYATLADLFRYSYNEPIAEAFYWDMSEDGLQVWKERDEQFIKYYYDDQD